jgi:hypothetical protein
MLQSLFRGSLKKCNERVYLGKSETAKVSKLIFQHWKI